MVQWELLLEQEHGSQKYWKKFMNTSKPQHISCLLFLLHGLHKDNYTQELKLRGFFAGVHGTTLFSTSSGVFQTECKLTTRIINFALRFRGYTQQFYWLHTLFQNAKNAQQHLSCNLVVSLWKDNWFMSWKTFTDCKLYDSWKLLNTRADVSFSEMYDCKSDLSCFPVSNIEVKRAFGVKHNIQQLLYTPADDLLLTEMKHNPGHPDVPWNHSNTMFHMGFKFLTCQLNNLRWSISQCGQWNKERDEGVGYGILTRNYLDGGEIREIGWQWMRSQ